MTRLQFYFFNFAFA